jgi:hypothetical protein
MYNIHVPRTGYQLQMTLKLDNQQETLTGDSPHLTAQLYKIHVPRTGYQLQMTPKFDPHSGPSQGTHVGPLQVLGMGWSGHGLLRICAGLGLVWFWSGYSLFSAWPVLCVGFAFAGLGIVWPLSDLCWECSLLGMGWAELGVR